MNARFSNYTLRRIWRGVKLRLHDLFENIFLKMSLVTTTTSATSTPRENKTRDIKRTKAFGLKKRCAHNTRVFKRLREKGTDGLK